jgi:hypothetical protein
MLNNRTFQGQFEITENSDRGSRIKVKHAIAESFDIPLKEMKGLSIEIEKNYNSSVYCSKSETRQKEPY